MWGKGRIHGYERVVTLQRRRVVVLNTTSQPLRSNLLLMMQRHRASGVVFVLNMTPQPLKRCRMVGMPRGHHHDDGLPPDQRGQCWHAHCSSRGETAAEGSKHDLVFALRGSKRGGGRISSSSSSCVIGGHRFVIPLVAISQHVLGGNYELHCLRFGAFVCAILSLRIVLLWGAYGVLTD